MIFVVRIIYKTSNDTCYASSDGRSVDSTSLYSRFEKGYFVQNSKELDSLCKINYLDRIKANLS